MHGRALERAGIPSNCSDDSIEPQDGLRIRKIDDDRAR